MSRVFPEAKLIELTVLYHGPATSGKTATLTHVFERTNDPELRRRWRSSASSDGGRMYDFLPMRLGDIRGFRTEICLVTVPSAPEAEPTRRDLVAETDGIVFVADCRPERQAANRASFEELWRHLVEAGRDLRRLPFVLQLNHADAPGAASLAAVATPLMTWHSDPAQVPVHASVASRGDGVFEALKSISKLCLLELRRRG